MTERSNTPLAEETPRKQLNEYITNGTLRLGPRISTVQ